MEWVCPFFKLPHLTFLDFVNLNGFLQFSSRIISYLSIHAYAQMWLLPYAYKKELSPHYKDLMKVAKAATSALTSGGLHVFYFTSVGSWITWFIPFDKRITVICKAEQIQKITLKIVLDEQNCPFVVHNSYSLLILR